MEHQTPSGFPGNFRKRKVLGTLWFPSGLPETLGQANLAAPGGGKVIAADTLLIAVVEADCLNCQPRG